VILAIDTATDMLGAALSDGDAVLWESAWRAHLRHTTTLAPLVAQALATVGLRAEDVRALGVTTGPGSFTALRVGLAFVQGYSLAHHIPVIGVPTLDVLAYAQPKSDHVLVPVLQAGRSRVAAGQYRWQSRAWRAEGEVSSFDVQALVEWLPRGAIVCGELDRQLREALAPRRDLRVATAAAALRRAGYLAEMVWQRIREGAMETEPLAPIYLSANHA
jgi:tRNA threonylcarbamoyladenosine biosynthesis protein TsaB